MQPNNQGIEIFDPVGLNPHIVDQAIKEFPTHVPPPFYLQKLVRILHDSPAFLRSYIVGLECLGQSCSPVELMKHVSMISFYLGWMSKTAVLEQGYLNDLLTFNPDDYGGVKHRPPPFVKVQLPNQAVETQQNPQPDGQQEPVPDQSVQEMKEIAEVAVECPSDQSEADAIKMINQFAEMMKMKGFKVFAMEVNDPEKQEEPQSEESAE